MAAASSCPKRAISVVEDGAAWLRRQIVSLDVAS
jgi:hypothetical protein